MIRLVYWAGAIVDLFFALAMITPSLWASVFGIPDFDPGMRYRVDMGVGASMMFGWTCLLLWASRRPIERRGVLLLTVFPVLTGLGVTGGLAAISETTPLNAMLPVFVLKVILITLFLSSYVTATRIAREAV